MKNTLLNTLSVLYLTTTTAFLLPESPKILKTKSKLAPSGIDGLPLAEQALVFGKIYAGLGISTAITSKVLRSPPPFSCEILGLLFIAAGSSHFALPAAYVAIFPPIGTWGLWFLPGSPQFHVTWTGIAEIAGGLGLLLPIANLRPIAAKCLFLLTIAITPANIYMYTHGALMIGAGPDVPLDLSFHYIRFLLQVALLTILATIASSSFASSGENIFRLEEEDEKKYY
mmetsp:Transcript_17280/g.22476  ORF Transcript_17280/g.22476 Transcript_17280/m.22476 type:complete len:228 (+) Transcript_17280:28-711(+)